MGNSVQDEKRYRDVEISGVKVHLAVKFLIEEQHLMDSTNHEDQTDQRKKEWC